LSLLTELSENPEYMPIQEKAITVNFKGQYRMYPCLQSSYASLKALGVEWLRTSK
jgi:hypothetical protein